MEHHKTRDDCRSEAIDVKVEFAKLYKVRYKKINRDIEALNYKTDVANSLTVKGDVLIRGENCRNKEESPVEQYGDVRQIELWKNKAEFILGR